MTAILILYSTTDGHTLRICQRLKPVIESVGHVVTLASIAEHAALDLHSFEHLVIGASIRYGKYHPRVLDFIETHRALLDTRPCAFFSVNIVARKAAKNRPETNPYVCKFFRQTSWKPAMSAVFAGRLDYPKCRFFDRQMIRLIMWLTGGPTDPASVVEFTDWQAVEVFAEALAAPWPESRMDIGFPG